MGKASESQAFRIPEKTSKKLKKGIDKGKAM